MQYIAAICGKKQCASACSSEFETYEFNSNENGVNGEICKTSQPRLRCNVQMKWEQQQQRRRRKKH